MTRSTCCNAPITYQGNRLVNDPDTEGFTLSAIYTCDGCGEETEVFEEPEEMTAEDLREQRGEWMYECMVNGD